MNKSDKISAKEMNDLLLSSLIKLQTKSECKSLLADLCTPNEVEQMAQRIMSAKLLLEGKTYAQVIALTDISSATLSRVSNSIQNGPGGYKKILQDN